MSRVEPPTAEEERRAIAAFVETLAAGKHGRIVAKKEDVVRWILAGEHNR